MATLVQTKTDIMIALADPKILRFNDALLKDQKALISFYQDISYDLVAQGLFLYKLPPKTLAQLFAQEIIIVADLIRTFTKTTISRTKIIDILRQLEYSARQEVIQELKAFDAQLFAKLDEQIDSKYQLVANMYVKDISVHFENEKFSQLIHLLDDPKLNLDAFQQTLNSFVRKDFARYLKFSQALIQSKIALFDPEKSLSSTEEFSQIIKLIYVFTINSECIEKFQSQIQIIQKRLIQSLFLYDTGNSICLILEQLPPVMLTSILVEILTRSKAKIAACETKP